MTRDELYHHFKSQNIYVRRYFYPLISDFPMYKGYESSAPSNLPVASQISQQVLCLPVHPNLAEADQEEIINIIMCASNVNAA